jgi:two-component system, NtrC family, response regulator HydG
MLDQELDLYWKTVVNTIRDGIMIVNTQGVIVSVNRAMEVMTGYHRHDLIGKTCQVFDCDACTPSRDQDDGYWCDLFRQGRLSTLKCNVRTRSGRYLHVIRNASLLKDSAGNVIGAVGTLTDISEVIEKDIQLQAFQKELRAQDGFHGIIGNCAAMRQVYDLIENAACSDAPVIIYGESGTGKELVARAVHDIGERSDGPYVKVNCAGLSDSLLESELFGHVRGAYTGAIRDRMGRFEKASDGDIFLDEIGDMPMATQVKLLRVLEEKVVERVGASTPIPVNVRIISATNRHLDRMVEMGKFRSDLFFRVNVIPIHLPALRERVEDIPLLADSLFRRIRLKSGKDLEGISNDAMDALTRYHWPGNVRELKSALEYAFVACHDALVQPDHLPQTIHRNRRVPEPRWRRLDLRAIEKQELIETLEKTGGNQSRTAQILGISRVTVYNRMKRYGISARKKVEIGS